MNGGTCFGRYNTNGTLSTQCFCLQGFTGNYCEATLCSSTSCNGGVCKATQNSIVCVCPTGKIGDRCQVIISCFLYDTDFDNDIYFFSMQMLVQPIHVYPLNDVNKLEININVRMISFISE